MREVDYDLSIDRKNVMYVNSFELTGLNFEYVEYILSII